MHPVLSPYHPPAAPPQFGAKSKVVVTGSVVVDDIATVTRGSLEPGGKADVTFERQIGGGAANVSMNLKKLGHNPMPLSRIAADSMGRLIEKHLRRAGIDLALLQVHTDEASKSWVLKIYTLMEKISLFLEAFFERLTGRDLPGFILVPNDELNSKQLGTGHSIVINPPSGDRSILTSRGASNQLRLEEVNWRAMAKAQGLYIANFKSPDAAFLTTLVDQAKRLNPDMVIAFNPGSQQLELGMEGLAPVLQHLDILNLNLEEARMLLDQSQASPTSLLAQLRQAGPKTVVITDGRNGAYATNGHTQYHMPAFETEVQSTVGAGDAFGSTLMAMYLDNPKDLGQALYYASAQAASLVQKTGAQNGLLDRKALDRWVRQLRTQQPSIQPKVLSAPLDAIAA